VRGRELGLTILIASLGFGAFYAFSFIAWVKALTTSFGQSAWTWWVVALPIAVIMAFAVFFSAWIGWVMLSASEAKKQELLKPPRLSREGSGCTEPEGRSRF
jgi:Kef-type K+ transport system membrane component KefB